MCIGQFNEGATLQFCSALFQGKDRKFQVQAGVVFFEKLYLKPHREITVFSV